MNELVRYLMDNLYLDFQGDITVEEVRALLGDDDSPPARRLLGKIIEEKGVDELLLALADTLREHIRTGVTEAVLREHLQLYMDS